MTTRTVLLLSALALAACAPPPSAGTQTGAEARPSGAEVQLRASVRWPLRRAGISDACIASLDTNQLTLVKTLVHSGPQTASARLKNDLRLRTFVRRYCPDL